MDYSKQNNEKKRKKIRSNAAKSKKKDYFQYIPFHNACYFAHCYCRYRCCHRGFKGVIDSAPDITASNVMPSKLKSVMYYPTDRKRLNW